MDGAINEQRLKLATGIHERDGKARLVAGIINLEEKVKEIQISPLHNPVLPYYHFRLALQCLFQPLDTNSEISKAILFCPLARSAQRNGESGETKRKERKGNKVKKIDRHLIFKAVQMLAPTCQKERGASVSSDHDKRNLLVAYILQYPW